VYIEKESVLILLISKGQQLSGLTHPIHRDFPWICHDCEVVGVIYKCNEYIEW
jgi:hypothetical protein